MGVYLPEPVFGHGQLYFALTQCRNHQQVKVHIKYPEQVQLLPNDKQRNFCDKTTAAVKLKIIHNEIFYNVKFDLSLHACVKKNIDFFLLL